MNGKVYLVGAGPGAPDLITLRGLNILREADIVFYDALVHPGTLDYAPQARKVAVGKRCSQVSTDQRFINRNLVEAAAKYQTVVRLKGGDPMLFGRAQEEIDALKSAEVVFEVVPGVTSALAASAQMGISLTRRGVSRSVTFATPRLGEGEGESDWLASAARADTTVLYMASGRSREVGAALQQAGVNSATPVAIVESASLPGSRVIRSNLKDLVDGPNIQAEGPALLFLGQVFGDAVSSSAAADESLSDSVDETGRLKRA
jgi:uroporphyrin-III C-methyltransferase